LHWQFIYRYDTHTAQESGSLFWLHAVVSCSSIMSTLFSAEAGCETGKRVVLSLVFTA